MSVTPLLSLFHHAPSCKQHIKCITDWKVFIFTWKIITWEPGNLFLVHMHLRGQTGFLWKCNYYYNTTFKHHWAHRHTNLLFSWSIQIYYPPQFHFYRKTHYSSCSFFTVIMPDTSTKIPNQTDARPLL